MSMPIIPIKDSADTPHLYFQWESVDLCEIAESFGFKTCLKCIRVQTVGLK